MFSGNRQVNVSNTPNDRRRNQTEQMHASVWVSSISHVRCLAIELHAIEGINATSLLKDYAWNTKIVL